MVLAGCAARSKVAPAQLGVWLGGARDKGRASSCVNRYRLGDCGNWCRSNRDKHALDGRYQDLLVTMGTGKAPLALPNSPASSLKSFTSKVDVDALRTGRY
jgi:hypothetical protein